MAEMSRTAPTAALVDGDRAVAVVRGAAGTGSGRSPWLG
jgi:hypothetical protein